MNLDDQKNVSWIIKYRPVTLKEMVGRESKILSKFIESGNLPHFIFESRFAGVGKTTLSKALIKDLNADYLELNSSMDRGIDVIRDKIVHFVQTISSNPGVKKIVFLDEADQITKIAQDSLRNLMETYSNNAVFVLTCNYIDKISDPIQNRCTILNFGDIDKKEIYQYLEKICVAEDLVFTVPGLNKLIDIYYPSIRNMIGQLQYLKTMNLVVEESSIIKIDDKLINLWSLFKDGKLLKVRDLILEGSVNPDVVLKFFFRQTYSDDTLSNKQKITLPIELAEINYRMGVNTDKTIQLIAGIFKMYIAMIK